MFGLCSTFSPMINFFGDQSSLEKCNLKELLKKETNAMELGDKIIKVFVTDTDSDILAGRKVSDYAEISCCIHKLMLLGVDAENSKGTEEVFEALKAVRAVVTHS